MLSFLNPSLITNKPLKRSTNNYILCKYKKGRISMELYLIIAFAVFYLITAFMLPQKLQRKIWTLAFIFSFVITSIAIAFVRLSRQDVMLDANQLNWYYILFLFGMISVALGIFNLWMYRKELWQILSSTSDDEDNDDNS